MRAYFDKHLTPKGRKMFDQVRTTICFEKNIPALLPFAYLDIESLVDQKDPLDEPIISSRLAQNFLGGDGSISQVPTYTYHGHDDDVISRPDVDVYVKQQCAGGARFLYVVDAGQSHLEEVSKRAADAENWIIGRLSGSIPVPTAC
ncbi:hypothetical protein A4X06_0g8321 [Tilletia controversa]|uniref:triacylglycerol lipase n=1 Tax=Tilletia controversa TaxID=13291 RepID=A0A8X7STA7_9BASI|nr:hypothetical protein A4X06_0g8321 [Tilletia controversa]